MKSVFLILFVLYSAGATAQKGMFFSSQNYVGLMEGDHGAHWQIETINGVRYSGWHAGVGTGIDWYRDRSIPLFVSLDRDIFRKNKRSFFIIAHGGIDFPWQKAGYNNAWGYEVEKMVPGSFWEAGAGYRLSIGKSRNALLVQVGYSNKYVGEKVPYYNAVPFIYPGIPGNANQPGGTDRFNYHFRTLSLKIGWGF